MLDNTRSKKTYHIDTSSGHYINNVGDCLSECVKSPNCQGVRFYMTGDYQGKTCYLHDTHHGISDNGLQTSSDVEMVHFYNLT